MAKTSSLNKSSEKLFKRLLQSCVLNGVFLLACILAFNIVLMPTLDALARSLLSARHHSLILVYVNPAMQLAFSFVWIVPVFLLSKIFNVLCHQEIADTAYEQKYGRPRVYERFALAQMIADNVFSCTMEFVFLIQSSIMLLVPVEWLARLLCTLHLCALYALYAFEYKWYNMGWDIRRRIYYIETRWPYFVGFGLSLCGILTLAGSYIYSATLFASIFPAFILSAIEANCEQLRPVLLARQWSADDELNNSHAATAGTRRHTRSSTTVRLPIFQLAIRITDFLFKVFNRRRRAAIVANSSLAQQQQTATAAATNNSRHRVNRFEEKFAIRKTN